MPHSHLAMHSENERLPTIEIPPITEEQLIRYAGASGDFNPIHTIEKRALEYGLPGVIAHGMLTMAFMGRLFSSCIEKGAFIQDFSARFKSKVFVGDILKVTTTRMVEGHRDDQQMNTDPVSHYQILVVNQNNMEVASGTATLQFINPKK